MSIACLPAKNRHVNHLGPCRLLLTIQGREYAVRGVEPEDGIGRAYELRGPDGTTYRVNDGLPSCTCTCADSVWRHDASGGTHACKHVRALRRHGLVDPPRLITPEMLAVQALIDAARQAKGGDE
jgi:hypothetical protein